MFFVVIEEKDEKKGATDRSFACGDSIAYRPCKEELSQKERSGSAKLSLTSKPFLLVRTSHIATSPCDQGASEG